MNSCFARRSFCSCSRALSLLIVGAWCGIALADAEPAQKPVTVPGVIPVVVRVELGSGAVSPTPASPAALSSNDLQEAVAAVIDNSAVRVQVLSLKRSQKPTIFISGKVSEEARDNAFVAANKFVPDFATAVVGHFEKEPGAPGAPPPLKTEVWPLTFVDSALKDAESDKQYEVQKMVEALNELYPSQDGDESIKATRNMLLLRGDEDTLHQIKRQLILLDAPGPQVQLDMWAIQISGKRGKEYSEVLSEIADDVRATQAALKAIPSLIQFRRTDFFKGGDLQSPKSELKTVLDDLQALGFDTNPVRHMSLNEKFIFLGLASKTVRESVMKQVKDALDAPSTPLSQLWALNKKGWMSRYHHTEKETFPQTTLTFSLNAIETPERDRKAIADFARSAVAFNNEQSMVPDKTEKDFEDNTKAFESYAKAKVEAKIAAAPLRLRARAATADALFKVATDAFTQDMQEMFLEPLLQRIVKRQGSRAIKGVSLVGRSRLVVTSGLSTSLQPELSAYVDTTRPIPLTDTLLKAFPGGTSSSSADTEGDDSSDASDLAGLPGILAKLPAAKAIALAALLNPPKPNFTEVAPGIGIEVRPAVLPDGGSARLQVNMHFGVTTTAFAGNEAEKDGLSYPMADAVKSHQVSTDAIVSAFDLFDISSFDISTTYPRPPGSIPVLGSLPLIGPAFQWRRKATELEHHSLILVNTVILPRALNLTQFYSGNP